MKNRIVAIVMALMMLTASVALGEAVPAAVSGDFTGTAKGFGGDVNVTVTLTEGVITNVTAEGASETQGIGSVAIEKLPAEIAATGSIAVDTVATATITSNAIIEAAKAALTAAGVNPEDYNVVVEKGQAEDVIRNVDVVVVGAGGAGMSAAITAADAGKTVVIVESQPMVGGNTVRATGGMNAAKTALQDTNTFGEQAGLEKTLNSIETSWADNAVVVELANTVKTQWEEYQKNPTGYFDSKELMELDTIIGGKGLNDATLVKTMVEGTESGIEWLSSIGADLTSVGSFGGASVKRIHRPVNTEGKTVSVGSYIVPILEKNVTERGIEILFETTATEIRMENGAVAGVNGVTADGGNVIVNAKAVILATGGFGANLEMVAELNPSLDGFMTTNAAGLQGQGIAMATAVGAATVDLEQIQIHPTVQADTAALITEGLRGDGAILVNAEGKRFIDEVGTRDVVSAAEIAQTGSYSWLIVDQKMVDASSVIAGYITKGLTVSGNTYEELANAMGVDAANFPATMEAWNANVAAKTDAEFGRTSFANPLDTAPFYGIKVTAGIHHTMGGLKINEKTEVLTAEGTAIPGLFAAGEVTGGVHGANRLGGNAVSDIVVFGRIAGTNAAEYVK
ncbi:MAG: flavocytochrome c [Clostridia bacterium]|nr:flavocytochrome c [Clostridia bacterium]